MSLYEIKIQYGNGQQNLETATISIDVAAVCSSTLAIVPTDVAARTFTHTLTT